MLLRPRKQKNSHFNVSPKMSAKKTQLSKYKTVTQRKLMLFARAMALSNITTHREATSAVRSFNCAHFPIV